MAKDSTIPIYLEVAPKKVFAGAIDWPGWCRSGRDEEGAVAALAAYAPRYARAIGRGLAADITSRPVDPATFDIVRRLKGGAGTDFGVPSLPAPTDSDPIDPDETERLAQILSRSWAAFDAAAEAADGIELRKGPRGGGRDVHKMVGHVIEADEAYVRQLGTRVPKRSTDVARSAKRVREVGLAAFRARALGDPVAEPSRVEKPWSPRYYVRRAAWHALDHAWEIEDRAMPEPPSR
jgi:hypothetical protein